MKKLGLLFLFSVCALAQDCAFDFSFTAAGDSNAFPNNGCVFWNFTYKNTGFSTLSVLLQSAPDASGVPGAWGTFAGTVTVGANPSTSTTGAWMSVTATATNLAAWVRVDLSGLTGSGQITGKAYGYKNKTVSQAGSGGAPAVTGSGASPQVAVWTAPTVLGGFAGFTFVNATNTLAVTGPVVTGPVAFASLPAPSNGMQIYCSDCTVTSSIDNTCKATGSGAQAFRVNGVWKCVI